MKKLFLLIALATVTIFAISCSTKDLSRPASINELSAAAKQEVADARLKPAAGNYKVTLYVNDADTTTATFKGYVFTFNTGGLLLAAVSDTIYRGTWESKNNGTQLKLSIDGTQALHNISMEWTVIKMTNTVINLSHPEHGIEGRDRLVFKMQ